MHVFTSMFAFNLEKQTFTNLHYICALEKNYRITGEKHLIDCKKSNNIIYFNWDVSCESIAHKYMALGKAEEKKKLHTTGCIELEWIKFYKYKN